jgi:hypothetical protein
MTATGRGFYFAPKKRNAQPEWEHQVALFQWARNPAVRTRHPELRLLAASLNGVHLSKAQAGKAYAAGMLKGEHDVRLPVPRGPYVGLSIEMKAGKNKPTPEQMEYGELIAAEGWDVAYCWTWEAARDALVAYLARGFDA